MTKKRKFYVVWIGVEPGIYNSWADCSLQINGYKGAQYKSFDTLKEATEAYNSHPSDYIQKSPPLETHSDNPKILSKEIIENSVCVDAACSGNPGPMEYRGVYTGNNQELFKFGPIWGTNNIGEFLAIVHALALSKQNKWDMPIYSDSRNAIAWVKNKKCNTKLVKNIKTVAVYELINRAEKWLKNNTYSTQIIKWNTQKWGEIPADFGRK
ncbi:MAG: ribonuclease H family protein [Bacteroides sp.]|nr:ribonuclease H family protein [Bacteroides sp.]MDD2645606.1 ribonuclease H family protein [Bacteroides sp.]MDD4720167.1 ribonuclease H family protein [Bacteroides sp.]NLI64701.1 ribonuclease H [Bacteroidales bacterium]